MTPDAARRLRTQSVPRAASLVEVIRQGIIVPRIRIPENPSDAIALLLAEATDRRQDLARPPGALTTRSRSLAVHSLVREALVCECVNFSKLRCISTTHMSRCSED